MRFASLMHNNDEDDKGRKEGRERVQKIEREREISSFSILVGECIELDSTWKIFPFLFFPGRGTEKAH